MSATAILAKDIVTTQESPASVPESSQEAGFGQRGPQALCDRARDAAVRYLELRDYEILDRDWPYDDGLIDIAAWDGETLVFVEVRIVLGEFPDGSQEASKRKRLEAMAMAYLGENDYIDVPVRFDEICVVPVGKDRAFLRHRINALGGM